MEKRRSVGITLFGIYILLFGFIKLYLVTYGEDGPLDVPILPEFLSAFLIISGVGILFLRKEAHLFLTAYFSIMGAISVITYAYAFIESLITFKQPMNDPAGYTAIHAVLWIMVMIVLASGFYFLPVIYLTRPKVKEQFK